MNVTSDGLIVQGCAGTAVIIRYMGGIHTKDSQLNQLTETISDFKWDGRIHHVTEMRKGNIIAKVVSDLRKDGTLFH